MVDAEDLLKEWGKWSRGGLGGLTARSNVWGANIGGAIPDISDEMALLVDSAVIALGENNRILKDVVVWTYRFDYGVAEISLKLGVGRHKVDKYLSEGVGFVQGRFSLISTAA